MFSYLKRMVLSRRLLLKRCHIMSSRNSLLHYRGSIRATLDGKEACNNTVFSTDGTYGTIILPQYQPTITKKRQTCSQSLLRESLNLMLKDVYRTGLAGIPYIVLPQYQPTISEFHYYSLMTHCVSFRLSS